MPKTYATIIKGPLVGRTGVVANVGAVTGDVRLTNVNRWSDVLVPADHVKFHEDPEVGVLTGIEVPDWAIPDRSNVDPELAAWAERELARLGVNI